MTKSWGRSRSSRSNGSYTGSVGSSKSKSSIVNEWKDPGAATFAPRNTTREESRLSAAAAAAEQKRKEEYALSFATTQRPKQVDDLDGSASLSSAHGLNFGNDWYADQSVDPELQQLEKMDIETELTMENTVFRKSNVNGDSGSVASASVARSIRSISSKSRATAVSGTATGTSNTNDNDVTSSPTGIHIRRRKVVRSNTMGGSSVAADSVAVSEFTEFEGFDGEDVDDEEDDNDQDDDIVAFDDFVEDDGDDGDDDGASKYSSALSSCHSSFHYAPSVASGASTVKRTNRTYQAPVFFNKNRRIGLRRNPGQPSPTPFVPPSPLVQEALAATTREASEAAATGAPTPGGALPPRSPKYNRPASVTQPPTTESLSNGAAAAAPSTMTSPPQPPFSAPSSSANVPNTSSSSRPNGRRHAGASVRKGRKRDGAQDDNNTDDDGNGDIPMKSSSKASKLLGRALSNASSVASSSSSVPPAMLGHGGHTAAATATNADRSTLSGGSSSHHSRYKSSIALPQQYQDNHDDNPVTAAMSLTTLEQPSPQDLPRLSSQRNCCCFGSSRNSNSDANHEDFDPWSENAKRDADRRIQLQRRRICAALLVVALVTVVVFVIRSATSNTTTASRMRHLRAIMDSSHTPPQKGVPASGSVR